MVLDRPHDFDAPEAIERIRALTNYWGAKYGTVADWSGNTVRISGKVKGVGFHATLILENGLLRADLKVGFLAKKLGGTNYVKRKLDDYLDPQNSLDALRARVP